MRPPVFTVPIFGDLPDFGGQQSCLEVDPDMFFPDGVGVESTRARELKPLCQGCPVFETCLEYALSTNVAGIWAGTTQLERQKMRRVAGRGNPQQQRAAANRALVLELTAKGMDPQQIIAQTSLSEQIVWRALRAPHDEPEEQGAA